MKNKLNMKPAIIFITLFFFNGLVLAARSGRSILSQTQSLSAGGGGTGDSPTMQTGKSTPTQSGQVTPVQSGSGTGTGTGTFNVKEYGARGDGKSDDCKALEAAWKAACGSTGSPKLLIPKGNYLTGPVKFTGPCANAQTITVQLEGTLMGSTNLDQYGRNDWVQFGWINRLTLTGGGTFDGQGAASWPMNKCPTNKNCKTLPTNIKFHAITNSTVRSITSLNSKYFHIGITNSQKLDISGLKITAPGTSPNTDGIHIERSIGVTIADSDIGTGDDCISIGHGNSHITVTGVNCGPGHGISVGSLGKYQNEEDVSALLVKDCTLTGTQNGIRIKTWENSPGASSASNMTFENIVMNNVANPIIIDQTYCPYANCDGKAPSRVKLQDIFFRNIRGTSSTPVAVTLECSKGLPCQNVVLQDVHLDHSSGGAKAQSTCQNVQAKFVGTQIPSPCM